jgi:hypothetical protein
LSTGRAASQSMQMPPFMRNSNGRALSLARWQYELLMKWVEGVTTPAPSRMVEPAPRPLSEDAAERRRQILGTLDASGDGP